MQLPLPFLYAITRALSTFCSTPLSCWPRNVGCAELRGDEILEERHSHHKGEEAGSFRGNWGPAQ